MSREAGGRERQSNIQLIMRSEVICWSRWLERVMGIEPTFEAWEAPVLPLNYTRINLTLLRFPSCDGKIPYIPVLHPSGHRCTCICAPMFKIAPGNFVKPTFEAWEAPVLPLNYTRKTIHHSMRLLSMFILCISGPAYNKGMSRSS